MTGVSIVHRDDPEHVLFRSSRDAGTVRAAVIEAVQDRTNLSGAYLYRAYLSGANLDGANLERDR